MEQGTKIAEKNGEQRFQSVKTEEPAKKCREN